MGAEKRFTRVCRGRDRTLEAGEHLKTVERVRAGLVHMHHVRGRRPELTNARSSIVPCQHSQARHLCRVRLGVLRTWRRYAYADASRRASRVTHGLDLKETQAQK
jgi:hypothetical protein